MREADPEANSEFLADALLAMMMARVFLYLRIVRELSLEQVIEGWTDVVRRLMSDA